MRPPATTVAGGFLFDGQAQKVLNADRSQQALPIKKDTFHQIREFSKCLLSRCDWGPFRLPSRSLRSPAAPRCPKKRMTSAQPTPKSKSATSCRTAAQPQLTA